MNNYRITFLSLFMLIAGAAYMFIDRGQAAASDDRTAIELTAAERNIILAEMRGFLDSIQEVVQGLAANDMNSVAKAARRSGMVATHDIPVSLMHKLPMGFKELGGPTHKLFDGLAREATEMGNVQIITEKLGVLMQNCVACHASYRLVVR